MRVIRILFIAIGVLFLFYSCKENYTPKARAYFRINYPEHEYLPYSNPCGFSFELPVYAIVEPDKSKEAEPCWYNIIYTPFRAILHLSYKEISDEENFYELAGDARDFVYRHTVKASEISEILINNDHKLGGVLYELEGNTATTVQFFITDSTENFLRAALYFDVKTNRDSLDPVIEFLKNDIKKMINSFQWSEKTK